MEAFLEIFKIICEMDSFLQIERFRQQTKSVRKKNYIGTVELFQIEQHKKIPVPRSINVTDVTGLYPLQQSLRIGSYVKMLVREVLSDKI